MGVCDAERWKYRVGEYPGDDWHDKGGLEYGRRRGRGMEIKLGCEYPGWKVIGRRAFGHNDCSIRFAAGHTAGHTAEHTAELVKECHVWTVYNITYRE